MNNYHLIHLPIDWGDHKDHITCPSTIVYCTRPRRRLPINGEFFDFDLDSFAVKVHSSAGSKITISAGTPTRSTPASFQPITLAGFDESQRTANCGSPPATISAIGNAVSRPVTPNGARSNS